MTRLSRGRTVPIVTVLAVALVVWYAAAVLLNLGLARSMAQDNATEWEVVRSTMSLSRPLLPSPQQIVGNIWSTVFEEPVASPRSLLYHAGVTASAAGVGFLLAVVLGIALAIGIVHLRVLERSLMLWIIASQTVPVLAIAPMVVVALGNVGLTGFLPKAMISGYLSFFPIVTGMVTGLRSPDPLQRDLMRTYSASQAQVFRYLRWPASLPFLFPNAKVGASLALVGAIVAELPTGAQAGLGTRLLTGSYYGQTLIMWSALIAASLLALLAIALIDLMQKALVASRGGRL